MSTHAWCRRLIEGLEAARVKDLVVSPGSRSTPILLAAIASKLQIHSVIDERSAAFFALGRARADHRPVAFLCTSGSAGSHALPALLEARYARHRVIAITADRPPELHDCGANQTIDQRHLFAAACPPVLDLGMPDLSGSGGLAMRRRVHQAVALARGPLHINAPFRKPLEPSAEECKDSQAGPAMAPVVPARSLVDEASLQSIAARCASATRGVIVAGPSVGCGAALQALAEASGFVLLAESTSGSRFSGAAHPRRCDAFPHILSLALHDETLASSLAPDLLLRFGSEPACTALNTWLAAQACPELRFAHDTPTRDARGASELVMGEVRDACERLAALLSPTPETTYHNHWRAADEAAWTLVDKRLDAGEGALSEPRAVATILRSLPAHTRLTLGNSMPVRSVDMLVPGRLAALEILHQRGTSGIDGLIAGAIGSGDTGASALLLGDVSFSHDLASLALAPLCRGPLRIFVIDNQGGQIFSHLPVAQADLAKDSQALWRTPPAVDIQQVCAAFGVSYQRAATLASLSEALAWSQAQDGCSVVQVCVNAESMLAFVQAMRGETRA